jgi:hypothetical protein
VVTTYSLSNGGSSATVTIQQDESVTMAVSPTTIGRNGVSAATITLQRQTVTAQSLAVDFSLYGGNSSDYTLNGSGGDLSSYGSTGIVTFSPNSSQAVVTLQDLCEPTSSSEAVSFCLSSNRSDYALSGTSAATGQEWGQTRVGSGRL